MLLGILLLWFAASGVMIAVYSRRELICIWHEPVLRRPIVIIESDDWGAGPAEQAEVLDDIKNMLMKISDRDGRHPVMTLVVILATPDGKNLKDSGGYQRSVISNHTHGAMLDVINSGVDAGVFSTQLHGMEHYWPAALLAAANSSATVGDWLDQTPDACTEELPSTLQSRWIDASVLPSRQLADADISHAVVEEVEAFHSVFGARPDVVVPPTFVWNEVVERCWAAAGVEVIVTPGRRLESRDAAGRPVAAGMPVYNGQAGEDGIVYMVRDAYFEPSLGHKAKQALALCVSRLPLQRPVLFETHRFNFVGVQSDRAVAHAELESLLRAIVKELPDLAFLSTGKLASVLKNRNPEWVDSGLRCRLHVWINRLGMISRLRRLVILTGWIVPVWLVWRITR